MSQNCNWEETMPTQKNLQGQTLFVVSVKYHRDHKTMFLQVKFLVSVAALYIYIYIHMLCIVNFTVQITKLTHVSHSTLCMLFTYCNDLSCITVKKSMSNCGILVFLIESVLDCSHL